MTGAPPSAASGIGRSAADTAALIAAERTGSPFLLWRDHDDVQQVFALDAQARVTIGRRETNDIALPRDPETSRIHAVLEQVGGDWTVTDDGLSRNGTFVGGSRISHRRRLIDGDTLRIGQTIIVFRLPGHSSTMTHAGDVWPTVESLTTTQRRILIALARPYKQAGGFAIPATNQQIADEVFLGVDAVKNHLRLLFKRFELAHLPQSSKRARLVECAFRWGLVSERDL
jgi:predicted component of type VI protein secretion system